MSVVKVTRGKVKHEPETPSSSTLVTPARKRVREEDNEPTLNPWINPDDTYRAARAKIFEMCSIGNWKEFRLVCKSWKDEITSTLYSTVEFNVRKYQNHVRKVGNVEYLEKFPWELTETPFQKYVLKGGKVIQPDWTRMWHDLGNKMKSLRISSTVSIHDLEFVRNALFASTPNLEELTFHGKIIGGSKQPPVIIPDRLEQLCLKVLEIGIHSEMIPVDECQLIRAFPNLECLRLRVLDKDSEQDLTTFIRHLYDIRLEDPNKLSNLKHINIIGAKTDGDDSVSEFLWELICPGIITQPLTLSTLAIDVGFSTVDSKAVLHSILKCCKKTIQTLDLYLAPDQEGYPGFPFGVNFPNLTVFRATADIVHTMDFLRFMPKLTTLHLVEVPNILSLEGHTSFKDLYGFCCVDRMKEGTIQTIGNSVRHFFCGYGVIDEDILALGKLMPNLQKVHFPVYDSEDLNHVLNVWTHLTHLYLLDMLPRDNGVFDLSAVCKHQRLVRFVQVSPNGLTKFMKKATPSQLVPWFYKKTEDEDDD